MELNETEVAAIELAARVKASLVDFATSPPFERHLRRLARESAADHSHPVDGFVAAVEKLLFDFSYDDGSTVLERFLRRPGLADAEREMARGFGDGVSSFFEVLADTPAQSTVVHLRCCLADLDHVVVPTEPAGMPRLQRGAFLAGRLNPVAGTELWTVSGAVEVLPAARRAAVADAALSLALACPWLTHRNPEKRRKAAEQAARMHQRFVARHGHDQVHVAGKDLAELYADAVAPDDVRDIEAVASARLMARRTIEESELAEADDVLVVSHPVAGFGFYREFEGVARALDSGSEAAPDDVELVRDYLDDPGVPAWLWDRVLTDRLPAAEAALSLVLRRPRFTWLADGEQFLASLPGDQEPVLSLAIVPELSSALGAGR